jgi:hypothetical protein
MSGDIAPKKIGRGYERNLDAGPCGYARHGILRAQPVAEPGAGTRQATRAAMGLNRARGRQMPPRLGPHQAHRQPCCLHSEVRPAYFHSSAPLESWPVSRRLLTPLESRARRQHWRPCRPATGPGECGRAPSMSRATVLPGDPRVRRRRPRRASEQAQVRANSERAIAMYQQPPARFSAPRTRKKAAHP